MYHGIIIVYKERGYTSHDVVAKLRGICGQKKIGHTGTLDPEATGVLPVCLGSGTKLCDMLTDKDKEYEAVLRLGVRTDTQDMTGSVLDRHPVDASEERVREVVLSFQGGYWQLPPMYSALKVNGRKLYELAREGREVERQAREVQIPEIEIQGIDLPLVKLRVVCSKGTYIRTLCADIGEKLGCGGAMESLVRTRVGGFGLEDAYTLEQIQAFKDQGRLAEIIAPVESVFGSCPVIHVREDMERFLNNGNALAVEQTVERERHASGRWVRVCRLDGSFAGIYAYDEGRGRYQPVKMFLEQE
ncbi:MAG: tRNA pseudouridine(55) synthase TruB [bacterium]|nr:tRNA pseudouridine(55) synthase TruB [bacterium]MCM1374960.1 tRNA pseudouridine(55) synthase TruB [Muribaculum sp.]